MIPFKRILAAVDGSDCASSALDVAIALATSQPDALALCSVIDPLQAAPALMSPYATTEVWLNTLTENATKELAEAVERAERAGVRARTELIDGNPVASIVDMAARHACDLIVMGSHGRSGLSRLIVGSVAEGVMRRANVPVLVVHARTSEKPA